MRHRSESDKKHIVTGTKPECLALLHLCCYRSSIARKWGRQRNVLVIWVPGHSKMPGNPANRGGYCW